MKHLLVILSLLLLSSCATHTATNELIAKANTNRLKEFASGVAACNDNAACQVAVSMAFAGNMGQQPYFREDSPLDYVKASGFILGPAVDILRLYKTTTSGDAAGVVIAGDNNQIVGMNKLTADNQSTLTGTFDTTSSIEHLVYTQDSTQSSSNGNGLVENVENQQDTYSGDSALAGNKEVPVE